MDGRLPTAHPWGIVVSIHHPWMRRTPTHSQGHPFRATDQRPSPNGFEFACGRACIHGWPWIPHVSMDQNSWTLVRGDRPMDTHRTLVGTAKAGDTFVLGGRSARVRTQSLPEWRVSARTARSQPPMSRNIAITSPLSTLPARSVAASQRRGQRGLIIGREGFLCLKSGCGAPLKMCLAAEGA